ncbi:MAG: hypothetical protein KBC34_00875 [Phenylobacterium sp.]|nr:hypothetical protein [Phenylobacterium sp.]
MNPFRAFGIAGQLALVALLVIAAALLVRCAGAPDRARARAAGDDAALARAHARSATDAAGAIAARAGRDAATDTLTRENADAIRSAPGAGQVLDPHLNRAGLDALCLRDAYRAAPACLRSPDRP